LKTKDLLFKLSDLESVLASYSFEELKVADAAQLKKSFEHFKYHLQEKISIDCIPTSERDGSIREAPLVNHSNPNFDTLQVSGGIGMLLKDSLDKFIGILNFLKDELTTGQEWDQVVEMLRTSTVLSTSVNTLLGSSPALKGLQATQEIEFDLYELVNNAKFISENLIVQDQLKIAVHGAGVLSHSVVGDMDTVMHIVLNMLGKTLQFAKKGEIYLQVVSKMTTQNTLFLEFQIDNFSCELIQTDHGSQLIAPNQEYYDNEVIKLLVRAVGGSIYIFKHGAAGTIFKFGIPLNKGRKSKHNP
jgi:hypothetical protein